MTQDPINLEDSIKFLQDFNVDGYVKTFFETRNIDSNEFINTNSFRCSFDILNEKVGLDSQLTYQRIMD